MILSTKMAPDDSTNRLYDLHASPLFFPYYIDFRYPIISLSPLSVSIALRQHTGWRENVSVAPFRLNNIRYTPNDIWVRRQ